MTTQTAATVAPASVPRLWPGSTIAILAGGPSLTQTDVDFCRGRARVMAIKDAIRLAPWADVLYSGEIKWWKHYAPTLTYEGLRYGINVNEPVDSVTMLRNTGPLGLELDPSGLRTGKNSGFQAVNVAVHLGAKKIVLLGYDMQPQGGSQHWFGKHPYWTSDPPYQAFLDCWPSIVRPLLQLGVTVVNASRRTALEVFPRIALEECLQ